MKITVKLKKTPLPIQTPYIKLQDAMKLAVCVLSGGEAKTAIQAGEVKVDGEVCTQRGKKLTVGSTFTYGGACYEVTNEGSQSQNG